MFYCGIDYHKKYSVVSVKNAAGQTILERRGDHSNPLVFKEILSSLGEPVSAVYESGLNWTWLYELLEKIENVVSITLSLSSLRPINYYLKMLLSLF